MGRAISKLKHPFRDFNLESRAHKVISQTKPTVAPKYEKDALDIQRMKQEYPDVFEASLKKNETLEKHLKDVYVVSHDETVEQIIKPSRPLPQDRSQPEQFLYGHKEPDQVPLGRTTLRNALQFISLHQSEPEKYTIDVISEENKLPKDIVVNVLKYYKVFEIYIPQNVSNTKATFAGPSQPKVHILNQSSSKMFPLLRQKKDNDNT